jgi:hypothetical protein
MNLLQRFCSAVIDTSDAFGASMQGVDVRTHRQNLYGHADGIVAARVEGTSPRVQVEAGGPARDPFAEDLDWGPMAPTYVAVNSPIPLVRAHADDNERWGLDDANRWTGS